MLDHMLHMLDHMLHMHDHPDRKDGGWDKTCRVLMLPHTGWRVIAEPLPKSNTNMWTWHMGTFFNTYKVDLSGLLLEDY
jgi:hypothetical protein